MPLVPAKKEEKVAFYRSKIAPWSAHAAAIGTSSGAVTALDALTTAAQDAIDATTAALAAYRAAVGTADTAVEAMGVAGADIISAIRTKGRTGGQPVYDLAQIPAPATPTPVGPPGQPTNLKVTLGATGEVEMKWKCANPTGSVGTTYNVFRYSGGGTPTPEDFDYVGGTGVREFTDENAPAGVAMIMYKIQAVRSTAVGPWATFNVFLGVNSGGTAVVKSVVNTTPKLVA